MTVPGHRDNAARRAERRNGVSPDHFPTCPRCGNLCGRLAVICADCGARLKPTDNELPALARNGRIDAMTATDETPAATRETGP